MLVSEIKCQTGRKIRIRIANHTFISFGNLSVTIQVNILKLTWLCILAGKTSVNTLIQCLYYAINLIAIECIYRLTNGQDIGIIAILFQTVARILKEHTCEFVGNQARLQSISQTFYLITIHGIDKST